MASLTYHTPTLCFPNQNPINKYPFSIAKYNLFFFKHNLTSSANPTLSILSFKLSNVGGASKRYNPLPCNCNGSSSIVSTTTTNTNYEVVPSKPFLCLPPLGCFSLRFNEGKQIP
uniref:Putative inactive shikimate kinase like 2ic n=1 Tax=Rhizophora mucronata TaxID=61149 RepID=A0A2P2KEP3_RHIMU